MFEPFEEAVCPTACMKLDLDRYVPGLVLLLSNKMASSASQLYRARFDIGVTDWRVMAFFEVYPWSTASKACEVMGIDKAAVSRSIALMMDRGWLKSRPCGLRKIEYRPSALGKKLHDEVFTLAVAREEALLSGFSRSEREILIKMLKRLLLNLDSVVRIGRGEPSQQKAPGARTTPSRLQGRRPSLAQGGA